MKFKQSQFILALILKWYVPIKNITLASLSVWMGRGCSMWLCCPAHWCSYCSYKSTGLWLTHNINSNLKQTEAFAQVVHQISANYLQVKFKERCNLQLKSWTITKSGTQILAELCLAVGILNRLVHGQYQSPVISSTEMRQDVNNFLHIIFFF